MEEILKDIFGNITITNRVDNFAFYELKFICNEPNNISKNINKNKYNLLNKTYDEYNYSWDLTIGSYSISQNKFDEFSNDFEEVELEVDYKIYKEGNKMVLFNKKYFSRYLKTLTLEKLLTFLSRKKDNSFYFFETYSTNVFHNNYIGYNYYENIIQKTITEISIQCNFRNYSEFFFNPEFFYLKGNNNETLLQESLSKLSLLYCLIFIFNSTEINEDEIILFISGDRSFKYTLNFKDLDVALLPVYYNIYRWTYSEESKKEDKIGIVRNVLTSYLKEESIEIDNGVYDSILSCNQIYIKGNISKYFEVRNKIIEQIEQTINKVNQSMDTFSNNFQKSIFVFISFYLSVFIFRIINKSNLGNIFNKETSLLGLGLIAISIIFLLFSRIVVYLEKSRIKERYNNIKQRYGDVLIKDDIQRILRGDEEYKKEIKLLDNRVCLYTWLWIITLLIFVIVLFLASDYLDLSLFLIDCKK